MSPNRTERAEEALGKDLKAKTNKQGERVCLRDVFVVSAIGRLALLGEHHRHVINVAQHGGNGYAACLDGQHFVDSDTTKTTFQLIGYLAHNVDVNLMIEEVVNLQYVALLDITIRQDFFFKKVHLILQSLVFMEIKDLSALKKICTCKGTKS